MRVGLEVWSDRFAAVEQTCRRAERLGLHGFYYGESPHDLNLDCWTTLAALARGTDRIRLGPVIANVLPTYRSTLLLARQAATVAAISDGRLDLRTGVGASARHARPWWEPFGIEYPDYQQRLDDLRSALEVLPRLWAATVDAGPGAEHGPTAAAPARPSSNPPPSSIPITVAARGERALRLAADHAQVWETSFCTPDEFRSQDAHLADLLDQRGGGRTVVRSLEVDGFVAADQAGLQRLLARVRAERGSAEDLEPVFERALLGTPARVAERLAALADAGVDQVVVALHDPLDPGALEALADAAGLG